MDKHPSKDIIGSYGDYLKDKKIVLCITASVAAYKAVDLARLLMRYGAEVYPVMSKDATRLVTPDLLHWATGNKTVTKLTKELEHIQLADYNRSDLIIIYPCTGNTISKIANGIDDTSITSIATVALGSKIPIIIAPAMHEAMYHNPILIENIKRLKRYATIIEPYIIENKAKIVEQEKIVDIAIRLLSKHKLKGKKILVTAGSTAEYIDPIRIVSSKASGKFGVEIAKAAYRLGLDVKLIYGYGNAIIPDYLDVIRVDTSKDMYDAVIDNINDLDILIMSAAVADYKPLRSEDAKIETSINPKLTIDLVATEKIVNKVKDINPNLFLVAFKALYNVSKEELIEAAKKKMIECKADMIFANDVGKEGSEMGSDKIEGYIIDDEVKHVELQSKEKAARLLLDYIASKFS
ncbi:MAG: phosphopantothenoylcysteine decarboxylase [Candidatus Nitrosocaldaceae archaeon]|nr:MAG: phosphopantothenoylcysteine decarboxylase [Candidatus Nitrosocaldaceae archaeon]